MSAALKCRAKTPRLQATCCTAILFPSVLLLPNKLKAKLVFCQNIHVELNKLNKLIIISSAASKNNIFNQRQVCLIVTKHLYYQLKNCCSTYCATSDTAGSGDSSETRSMSSVKLLARDISWVFPSKCLFAAQIIQRNHNKLGKQHIQALSHT